MSPCASVCVRKWFHPIPGFLIFRWTPSLGIASALDKNHHFAFFLDFSYSIAKLDYCGHFQISLSVFFFPLGTFGHIIVTPAARGWLISTSYFAALPLSFKSPEIGPGQSRFRPTISGVYGPESREVLCLEFEGEEFSWDKYGIVLLET